MSRMRNKGLTVVETLVVALIAISFLGIIFGVFLVGRNSWAKSATYIDLQEKSRLALDRMTKELSLSNSSLVTIGDCPHPEYPCYGNYIEFQVPVATDGTIYDSEGNIKFGAENHIGWSIKYLVEQGGANDHRLVRITPEEIIPVGACCNGSSCSITTQQVCTNTGGTYKGDDTICTPNPCTGACCNGTSCSIKTPLDCSNSKGTYKGDGTSCTGSICGTGSCFLPGTPILMADGSTKPIEEVKPADIVMAFDEQTGKLVKDKVVAFFEHDADEYLIINDNLKVTKEHPIYSNGAWVKAGKLKIGDMLLDFEGKPQKISNIKLIREPVKVYNLEVNPYHTYIAAGVVVHNKTFRGDDGEPLPWGFLRDFLFLPFACADEISILASDIENLTVTNANDPGAPSAIEITITAKRKSMLGEPIEVKLKSRVYLRN